MKPASLATLMLLLLTTSVQAQEASGPPDVTVLEKSWRKEAIDTQRDSNPLQPNEDLMRVTRAQKVFIRERDYDLPNQTTEPSMPAAGSKPVTPAWAMNTRYVYKIKIQNNGAKTIKGLDWEYQFLNPDTQEVIEQRKISSKLSLRPGKSQVVERRLTRKPTVVVAAGQLGRKYRDQFTERVVITKVLYTDGSVWQRP